MSVSVKTDLDLGLMGGMFDPVHYGHINIALTILKNLHLDSFHLLPCGNPVHREHMYASSADRLAMLELAIGDIKELEIDCRECRSDAPSYTLNSLRAIRQEFPTARLFWVLGQDAFNSFDSWYNWREILTETHIVVAGRPGCHLHLQGDLMNEFERRKVTSVAELKQQNSGRILTTQFEMLDISSSRIRDRLESKKNVDDLLPQKVVEYIVKHKLYSAEKNV